MKNFTILFALLFTLSGFGQTYALTESGLIDSNDPQQGYTVFEFDGMNAPELYESALTYLNSSYENPDAVLATVPGESISVHGISGHAVKGRGAAKYDLDYAFTLRFKDGKMRVDVPTFEMGNRALAKLYVSVDKRSLLGNVDGIWVRGDLKIERAKTAIETFFNSYVTDLTQNIGGNNW